MSGSGNFRIVFDVQQMLTALEMPSDTPFLYYAFTESFIEENPDVVAAYADAYEEAIQYINENDEVWQDIAVNYDEDDPATIDRLMENSRNKIAPRYYNEMEDDIRDLFAFLRAEFDERVLGVSELPEQIFWSEAGE
jgi:ABC-type nitrate/sulfonate/bicarbonate transport system substrate-binding protein